MSKPALWYNPFQTAGHATLSNAVGLAVTINACRYNKTKSFVMAVQSRTSASADNDATILARFLTNGDRPLPKNVARYILTLTMSEGDKARMHELVVRNLEDDLTPAEKIEMHDFGLAGDVLAILKSKARCTLGVKPKKRTAS
jgi:hypothetical protein